MFLFSVILNQIYINEKKLPSYFGWIFNIHYFGSYCKIKDFVILHYTTKVEC